MSFFPVLDRSIKVLHSDDYSNLSKPEQLAWFAHHQNNGDVGKTCQLFVLNGEQVPSAHCREQAELLLNAYRMATKCNIEI